MKKKAAFLKNNSLLFIVWIRCISNVDSQSDKSSSSVTNDKSSNITSTETPKCTRDRDCGDNKICKIDGLCGVRGRGKGLFDEECDHISDCSQNLPCLRRKCSSFGLEGNPCKKHTDCRGLLYCSGIVGSKSSSIGKCKPRRELGKSCLLDNHCINSVCIPMRVAIAGDGKISEFKDSFCSLAKAKYNENCNPKVNQCVSGLICTKNQKRAKKVTFKTPALIGSRFPDYKSYQSDYVVKGRRRRQSEYPTLDGNTFYEDQFSQYNANDGEDYQVPKKKSKLRKFKSKNLPRLGFEFICKPPPCISSGEACETVLDCGCGEFCNPKRRQCQTAACTTDNECQAYPGYSATFNCRNNICMLPQNIYAEAFDKQFDNENILKGDGSKISKKG